MLERTRHTHTGIKAFWVAVIAGFVALPGFCEMDGNLSPSEFNCSIERLNGLYTKAQDEDPYKKAMLAIGAALSRKEMEEVNQIYSEADANRNEHRLNLTLSALVSEKPIEEINSLYYEAVGDHYGSIALTLAAAVSDRDIEELNEIAMYDVAAKSRLLTFGVALSGENIRKINVRYDASPYAGRRASLLVVSSVLTGKKMVEIYRGIDESNDKVSLRLTVAAAASGKSAKEMNNLYNKAKDRQAALAIASALTGKSIEDLNALYSKALPTYRTIPSHPDNKARIAAGAALCNLNLQDINHGVLLAILVGILEVL